MLLAQGEGGCWGEGHCWGRVGRVRLVRWTPIAPYLTPPPKKANRFGTHANHLLAHKKRETLRSLEGGGFP